MDPLKFEITMPRDFEERLFKRIAEMIESSFGRMKPSLDSGEKTSTDLISRLKVAELFGVSLTTIDKWRKCRILPAEIKIGSRVYFSEKALEELLRNKTKFLREYGTR